MNERLVGWNARTIATIEATTLIAQQTRQIIQMILMIMIQVAIQIIIQIVAITIAASHVRVAEIIIGAAIVATVIAIATVIVASAKSVKLLSQKMMYYYQ